MKKIGLERVRSLNIQMYGYPIVSDTRYGQEKYSWSEAGPGLFVLTHSSTDKKFSQLIEVNDALALGLRIAKI